MRRPSDALRAPRGALSEHPLTWRQPSEGAKSPSIGPDARWHSVLSCRVFGFPYKFLALFALVYAEMREHLVTRPYCDVVFAHVVYVILACENSIALDLNVVVGNRIQRSRPLVV